MQSNTQYTSSSSTNAPVVSQVLLPTQIVEKPVAVHETIRKELVQEIQPIVNVEKVHTEVHQVTQPLFDKEVRAVQVENRTLGTEILPEVFVAGRGVSQQADVSTISYRDTATVVVEKPAMFMEVEKRQIIEEIQPVIYKETIIPEVIQETKPVYQKIVEGPVYSQTTLAARGVENPSIQAAAYVPDNRVVAPVHENVMLPTQIVQKPAAVHEEIRKEVIEEIQPVVNVEKIHTEVHQVTQPLFDREVRAVDVQQRTLATEILPEVLVQGRGARSVDQVSTTEYQQTNTVVVEKPAQFIEVERTQIIEEIQPVIYKETVVPHVIKETKPVFQKIVEGPVYTQQTLPAQQLHGSSYENMNIQNLNIREVHQTAPVVVERVVVQPVQHVQPVVVMPVQHQPQVVSIPIIDSNARGVDTLPVHMPAPAHDKHKLTIVEDTITTTTTTSVAPVVGANMGPGNYNQQQYQNNTDPAHKSHGIGGLFHRHGKDAHDNTHVQTGPSVVGPLGTTAAPIASAPLGTTTQNHVHTDKNLPGGMHVVEDTVSTSSHSTRTIPTK